MKPYGASEIILIIIVAVVLYMTGVWPAAIFIAAVLIGSRGIE